MRLIVSIPTPERIVIARSQQSLQVDRFDMTIAESNVPIPSMTSQRPVPIVHCRRCRVGEVDPSTAQPPSVLKNRSVPIESIPEGVHRRRHGNGRILHDDPFCCRYQRTSESEVGTAHWIAQT